jgi:hypothetical protein
MAVTRANFGELLEPGLAHVFFHEIDVWEPRYPELFNIKTSAKKFEEDLLVTGLGLFDKKTEGNSVTYDDIAQGWKTTYTHDTFAKAITITQEMVEDDLYDIMNDMTVALARAAKQRKEVDGHSVLNNAFSTTTGLGADGVSLINASHVLKVGGTQSNALSAEADLSVASLQEAISILETTLDERALNVALMAKKLVVPTALQFTAAELLHSTYKPGVSDNDINAIQSKGIDIVVSPFLTDTDSWFLLADQHKLMWYDRTPLSFFKGNDFDTDNVKFKGRMRYSKGFSDWRGVVGSSGA